MTQGSLDFSAAPRLTEQDKVRLGRQLLLVKGIMGDGKSRTLSEISALTGAPEASVSARLRELRNKCGLTVVTKRTAPGSGLYTYQVVGGGENG